MKACNHLFKLNKLYKSHSLCPKPQAGFTLVELLVVISIISLLASVVLSSLNRARDGAEKAAGLTFENNVHKKLYNCLVAQYDFEVSNNLGFDSSGYGRNASILGAIVDDGINGSNGLRFDGDDNFMSPTLMNLPMNETVSLWFNPTNANGSQILQEFGQPSSGGYNYSKIGFNGDGRIVTNYWACNSSIPIGPGLIKLNEWNHILLSYKNGKMFSYLNGNKYIEMNCNNRQPPTNQHIGIGYTANSVGGFDNANRFVGTIDNVRVYSCAI